MALEIGLPIYQRLNKIAFFVPENTGGIIRSDGRIIPCGFRLSNAVGDAVLQDEHTSFTVYDYEVATFFRLKDVYLKLSPIINDIFRRDQDDVTCRRGIPAYHREIIEKIKRQSHWTEQKILGTAFGIFPSIYRMAMFFDKFTQIYANYRLVSKLGKIEFLNDVKDELLVRILFAPRELPTGLQASISWFADILDRYPDEQTVWSTQDLTQIIFEARGLSQELQMLKSYTYRSERENNRRIKISTTKRENNRAGSEEVVKICRLIQLSAEKNGVSKKSECEKYFRENSALLNRYGIHSSRTLENRCSNTRPNRVRGIKNSTDAPCPIPIDFWHKLNHITSI